MGYLLTRRNLKPSARVVAKTLGLKLKVDVDNREPPTIRWGNSDIGDYNPDLETSLNYPEVIKIVSNKRVFAKSMEELQINCVKLQTGIPEGFPVVVRQTLTGSKGEGIVICKDLWEFNNTPNNRFWTKWHNFRYELGVHTFKGQIIKLFKKVWTNEEPEPEFPIKNMVKGYHFSRVKPESFPTLPAFVENYYNRFGMSFGRLDIGFDIDMRQYVIIEANSAPGILENDDTIELYTNLLKQEIANV